MEQPGAEELIKHCKVIQVHDDDGFKEPKRFMKVYRLFVQ